MKPERSHDRGRWFKERKWGGSQNARDMKVEREHRRQKDPSREGEGDREKGEGGGRTERRGKGSRGKD